MTLIGATGLLVAGLALPGVGLAGHGLTFRDVAYSSPGPGKFKSKLKGTTARTQHGKLDGTWTINLAKYPSGPLGLTWNGHRQGGGTYRISYPDITFTPKKGGSCSTKGKYTMIYLSATKLKFKKLSDTCAVRKDVLTFGPWTKIS
jgi:hypothetical protein